ncbi:Na+-dependent transporter [Rhodopseudomonas palustris]|nr:Na+-dependent transporter [Rhodopseudomonas palustris]
MPFNLHHAAAVPVRALAWLGRQGTRAIAALVFVGLAAPTLGAWMKPFLGEAIFLLLCVSFMRVDMASLRANLRRPGIVIAATAWTTLAVPLIVGVVSLAVGLDHRSPDLFLALMLQAVASPMMAAPALAALMGLDATLVLITLVTSTALIPFTAPLLIFIFVGPVLTLSPLALGLKLAAILGGSLLVAAAIRRIVGGAAIRRHKEPIDGFNVIVLFVFVAAIMGSVTTSFLADPAGVIVLALFAFVVFAALLGATLLIFRAIGDERALALGLMVSQRNMGLMLAATDGALPGLTWLYFALAQFPIYLSPQLLKPLARRLTVRSAEANGLPVEAGDGRPRSATRVR